MMARPTVDLALARFSVTRAPLSLDAMISEVEAELDRRRDAYPRDVSSRRMREGEAALRIQHMEAVLTTLRWLKTNEAAIRAAVQKQG